MSYLVCAIDGTHSSAEHGAYNVECTDTAATCVSNRSYTRQFHDSVDVPNANKHFQEGPEWGASGWDSDEIAQRAWVWLRGKLATQPEDHVVLVGHSRGGHIATQLAIWLSRHRQGAFADRLRRPQRGNTQAMNPRARVSRRPIQPVLFLGLYDAVDMTTDLGDTGTVPSNVVWFYHARRDPSVGSHGWWGNTATRTAREDSDHYRQRNFRATHGSLGGAIPEPCEEGVTWGTCDIELSQADNRAEGDRANEFILAGARRAGIPFR